MSDYTKSTNFATKDNLPTGNALKIVKGTEIDTEFNSIATAIATKSNASSPTFTGTITATNELLTGTLSVAGSTTLSSTLAVSGATTLSSALNYGGVALSNAVTGTGNMVLSASPTLTGTIVSANQTLSGTLGITGALTYGGIALTAAVTGTGKMVLDTSPSISGAVLSSMASSVITSASVLTPTSTSATFTSIPSWAKRITVMLSKISTNGTSIVILRLGTSAGIDTASTYIGNVWTANTTNDAFTTSFLLRTDGLATNSLNGSIVLTLLDAAAYTWTVFGSIARPAGDMSLLAGSKILAGVLDRISLTTVNGTDAFDAGSINILYE